MSCGVQATAIDCYNVEGNAVTSDFNTSNVTFRGEISDACAGSFSGNDSNGTLGLNMDFWSLLAKDDLPGDGGTSTGILPGTDAMFTLTETGSGGSTGSWDLSWSGSDLPVEMNIAAVLKGSNYWTAYLFKDENFDVTPTTADGTWAVQFLNDGGQIPSLSHFSLYYSDLSIPPPPSVAEPASLASLGLGLLGLWFVRRRTTA